MGRLKTLTSRDRCRGPAGGPIDVVAARPLRRAVRQARVVLAVGLFVLSAAALLGCGGRPGETTTSAPPATSGAPGGGSTSTSTLAPGPSSTTSATEPPAQSTDVGVCSTSGVRVRIEAQSGLPEAVATMRDKIFAAALACDFDTLQQLARAGSPEFTYSFGEPSLGGRPGAYWREQEAAGEPVMVHLVKMLNLPGLQGGPGQGDTDPDLFVWPFAYGLDFTDLGEADKAKLLEYYDEQEVLDMEAIGGYYDYRVGITAEGDWIFFVAGD